MNSLVPTKPPTYHRQRLLLFIVEAAEGNLSKRDLHKLLLLYSKETVSSHYSFVPYKFGCYSFLCNDDLDLLDKRGWIKQENDRVSLESNLQDFAWARCSAERRSVKVWMSRNQLRGEELIAESYRRYPYYAIHSEIKEDLLNTEELDAIRQSLEEPSMTDNTVFTLGYEGIQFEDYLNKLIRNHVFVLCDVRRNPLSRKFGFSSKMFSIILPTLGIEYIHFPELGIDSEKRQHLASFDDYKNLFSAYIDELPSRHEGIERLVSVIEKSKRVALTCFEAHHKSCHRHCISDLLGEKFGFRVEHL